MPIMMQLMRQARDLPAQQFGAIKWDLRAEPASVGVPINPAQARQMMAP